MTLVDVKNALFSHFLTSTIFDINEDVVSLALPTKELPEKVASSKVALVKTALIEFEKMGVAVCYDQKKGLYILSQPVDSFIQPVNVGPVTAEMVADLVNLYREDEGYRANKMALTNDDITCLCHFCHTLLSDGDPNFDENESESED